jgi:hypothetical protein
MLLRLALLALLCAASVRADEIRRSIKLAELPTAVRETATRQQADGTLLRLEKINREGAVVYETEFSSGGAKRIVLINSDGKIVEIRQPVNLDKVSRTARAVIESSVGKGKLISLESVKTDAGIVAAYQVRFEVEGKKTILRVRPDGSLAQE